jgi:hypothetical protein
MNRLIKAILVGFLLIIVINTSYAQTKTIDSKDLIQFSGVVIGTDSLQPVSFASVMIHSERRGTVTDIYGFFSFVAMKGDTIDFKNIGYKPARFVIPDTLSDNRYSIIQALVRDTITLKEAVVYPWPSKEEFKRAFLELQTPDDDYKRAKNNLALARMKEVQANVPYDGSINYKFSQQQQQTKLYSAGQYPSYNIFNPIAWAAFIQSWKDGAYKKKDKKNDE